MKITDTSGVNGPGKPKKGKKTSGDGGVFDAMLHGSEEGEKTEGKASVSGSSQVDSVGSLLGLQEVPEDQSRREYSMQQGRQTLDVLDELRRDLLLGDDSPHLLQRMRQQQQRLQQQPHDPRLQAVIDDIDLRLAVEIAKREVHA